MSNPKGTIGHPHDDVAAYALDALDGAERQAVDDHLAHCPECRAELADHHETVAALVPEQAPPATVWTRIATEISGMADPRADGVDTTVRSLRQEPATRPRRPPGYRWLAVAAATLVVAFVGGAVGYALGSSGDDADISSLAQQAADDPHGVLATLADATGDPVAQVVADDDGAYVVLSGLDDLPEGRAYQLWSLTGEEPVSLGMLGRDGSNTVAFRLPPTITELAISVEQTSGETAPTTDFQASGTITRS